MFMHWFRRNQKVLIGVLVVVIMITWGGLSALRYMIVDRTRKHPVIAGKAVDDRQRARAEGELDKLQRRGGLTATHPIGVFIYGDSEGAPVQQARVTNEAVWRYLVLLGAAEQAGVQVTEQETDAQCARLGGCEDMETRRAAANLARLEKLYLSVCESAPLSDAELWLFYTYREHSAKVRYVGIGQELFLSQVSATPEEVQKLYEDNKNVAPDEERGVVGYLAPVRVRLEYAAAEIEAFKKTTAVSDDEVKEYYALHKDAEFRLPEEKPKEGEEPAAKADKPEEADDPPAAEAGDKPAEKPDATAAEPEKAVEKKPEDAEEPAEGAAEGKEKPPSYKPLDQVAGEIREKLVSEKAAETARSVMNRMLDDLQEVAGDYVNEPVPLQQMAKRHRLTYKKAVSADGRDLLTMKDVEAIASGGPQAARRIFEQKLEVNGYTFLDTVGGPVVLQVLDRREPEPRPFEEVAAEARQAVLRQKAFAHARTVGGKLQEAAQVSSLDQAVAELNERLRKLLGPDIEKEGATEPEQKPAGEGEKAEAKPEAAAEEAAGEGGEEPKEAAAGEPEKNKPKSGPLEVKETDYFPRGTDYIIGLPGSHPGLKEKAFELQNGAFAVVAEEGQAATCYVIQKTGEKAAAPEDFQRMRAMRPLIATVSKMPEQARNWMEGLLAKWPPPQPVKREGGTKAPEEPIDF